MFEFVFEVFFEVLEAVPMSGEWKQLVNCVEKSFLTIGEEGEAILSVNTCRNVSFEDPAQLLKEPNPVILILDIRYAKCKRKELSLRVCRSCHEQIALVLV